MFIRWLELDHLQICIYLIVNYEILKACLKESSRNISYVADDISHIWYFIDVSFQTKSKEIQMVLQLLLNRMDGHG